MVNFVYRDRIVHGVYYIVNPVGDMKTREPMIGALLHAAWAAARARISAGLMDAGFTDLLPAHLMVLQYPGPDGERPSTLARRAGMSKQAMNQLLGSLEQMGYIERVQDERDGRARIVRVTERGALAITTIRGILEELEREWAVALGVARFAELKSILETLRQLSPSVLE
jgi:DNA-binding MarR family transcriptional regulator